MDSRKSMFLTRVLRIYPTKQQEKTLLRWMWLSRRIWNHFLEHRIKVYKRRSERSSYMAQSKMLTKWRSNDPQMRSMPVEFQRDALDRLHKAFDAFFRRVKAGEKPGFPRFKGKNRWNSLSQYRCGIYIRGDVVRIPGIGAVKARNPQRVSGESLSIRVVKTADRWYAHTLVSVHDVNQGKVHPVVTAGIDVGLESFATLSSGEQIENPRWFRKAQKKLRRAQRIVSRRKKGSKRREKAKLKVAKIHMRISDSRKDFVHKLSLRLVGEFDLIAVESLIIKNMVRGRFAKSIFDAAWAYFLHCLRYKAEKAGKWMVEVDPRGTSQTCSGCGNECRKALGQRMHQCNHCGLQLHRDHNAAINILSRVGPVGSEFTHAETPLPGRRKAAGKGRRSVKV